MFRTYPLFVAPRNERRSSPKGTIGWFFNVLFGVR